MSIAVRSAPIASAVLSVSCSYTTPADTAIFRYQVHFLQTHSLFHRGIRLFRTLASRAVKIAVCVAAARAHGAELPCGRACVREPAA
jgi:hypothetical protein